MTLPPRFVKFQAAFRTEMQRGNSISLLLPLEHYALNTSQLFILSFAMCKGLLCLLCRYVFNTPTTTARKKVVKMLLDASWRATQVIFIACRNKQIACTNNRIVQFREKCVVLPPPDPSEIGMFYYVLYGLLGFF